MDKKTGYRNHFARRSHLTSDALAKLAPSTLRCESPDLDSVRSDGVPPLHICQEFREEQSSISRRLTAEMRGEIRAAMKADQNQIAALDEQLWLTDQRHCLRQNEQ
eukprot:4417469-Amphidinium_carterae.1